ncbi:MAG: hypothetical protein ACKO7P_03115 [Bacteroidota bacterium]
MKDKLCNPCLDYFTPKRKDQRFCSDKCRISASNSKYRKQMEPYRNILEKARITENNVEKAFIKGDIFYSADELFELKIDLRNALKLYFDSNGYIYFAIFGRYTITRDENGYRIYKN